MTLHNGTMSSDSPAPAKIRVLLVEDQTAIRQMLAAFVAAQPGFEIVGETATCQETLSVIETLKPDVVVLDWMLPDGTGQDVLAAIRRVRISPAVLVFSANTTDLAVRTALSYGARGYIEKTASFEDFTQALKQVAAGQVYLGTVVSTVVHRLVRSPQTFTPTSQLSSRETDILRHVAEGLSSKEIAALLNISVRTVDNHRAAVTKKTGLRSVAQLTLYAYELGLVSLPGSRRPSGTAEAS